MDLVVQQIFSDKFLTVTNSGGITYEGEYAVGKIKGRNGENIEQNNRKRFLGLVEKNMVKSIGR